MKILKNNIQSIEKNKFIFLSLEASSNHEEQPILKNKPKEPISIDEYTEQAKERIAATEGRNQQESHKDIEAQLVTAFQDLENSPTQVAKNNTNETSNSSNIPNETSAKKYSKDIKDYFGPYSSESGFIYAKATA